MALRARCWGVIRSKLVMDHLLEDRGEVVADVLLEDGGQALPDVAGVGGHSTSQSSATAISSVTAACVSLVCRDGPRRCQRSGGAGNAQGHALAIEHVDVTGALEWSADRQHGKGAPKEWVHGVSDLDLGQLWFSWVH